MWKSSEVLLKKNLNAALQTCEAWTTLIGRVAKLEKDLPAEIQKVKDSIPDKDTMETLAKKSKDFVTKTELAAEGTGSYTKTEADGKFVTKAEAGSSDGSGFVTTNTADSTYVKKTDLAAEHTGSYTKDEADGKFVAADQLENKVKALDLSAKCETPEAAQAKATGALSDAKQYTDQKITALVGGADDAYDTLKEIETFLKKGDEVHAAINKMLERKTNKFAGNIGNNSEKQFTVTHNLKTTDVTISLYDNGTKNLVFSDVVIVDENNVKVVFDADEPAPTQDQVRIVIVG